MTPERMKVAVVGLGFGQDFIPIYLAHPNVGSVVLIDPDARRREEVGHRFGITETHAEISDVLGDPSVDAVHILAPVHTHAEMAVSVLDAGKHCACAVPMATTLEDLNRIIAAQTTSGKNYMMMETTVYGREYLTVEQMHRRHEFGDLTLYRGFHIQNLDGFPRYWQGYPPMHYITHALSPALALLGTTVDSVQCRGAGRLTIERSTGGFDNPYPTEAGLFSLRGTDVLAEVTMSFFQTARSYIEGFALYGDVAGVEWPSDNEGDLTLYRMRPPLTGRRGNSVTTMALPPGDFSGMLPAEIAQFTRSAHVRLSGMPSQVTVPAHHGGSHPFLVHEFISSITEARPPAIDARRSASWTAPGICAHQSAMAGGTAVAVPDYAAVAPVPATG